MWAFYFWAEDKDHFLQILELKRSREIPAICEFELIVRGGDGELSGLIFAVPVPIESLFDSEIGSLVSVDLSEANASGAFVDEDVTGSEFE